MLVLLGSIFSRAWHTIAVLTEHVVCFEVKPGPYSAENDKTLAPWAPREGDPRAGASRIRARRYTTAK